VHFLTLYGPDRPTPMREHPFTTREQLMAEIAARVRRTVPDMPRPAFDEMVAHMAELELKYRQPTAGSGWRQVTPPLGVPVHLPPP
jgi:hypothetical protein